MGEAKVSTGIIFSSEIFICLSRSPSPCILKIESLKLQLPPFWQGTPALLCSILLLRKIGISSRLPWCFQARKEIPMEGSAEACQTRFARDLSWCLLQGYRADAVAVAWAGAELELCGDRGDKWLPRPLS